MSERQPARWEHPGVALGGLVAVFFAANFQLLAGWSVEHWDGEQFFAPFFSYLAHVVRSGHWLLWNPFSNAGSPDFAEPQVGAFSPLTLAFAAVAGPSGLAFRLYWLCAWLLGGVGMFVYARSLGAPVWGRLLGALSFVFSGYYIGHAQHISVVYSISFLPWIVWRLDRSLRTGQRGPALEAGALWGLSALAGNPAVTVGMALFVGALAVARLAREKSTPMAARLQRGGGTLLWFALVGAVVLAPVYFSFKYESIGYSDRSGPLAREIAVGENPIEPRGLTALLSPYLPSLSRANAAQGGQKVEMSPIYFGAAPLALALLALTLPRSRGWKWSVFGVGLLFLGFTLGTSLPLRGWLYDLVPPTQYFRHPNMFRVYFIFAVIVLAVLATSRIERWRRNGAAPAGVLRRFALLSGALAVLGVGTFVTFYLRLERLGPYGETALLHSAGVWIGLAGLCAVVAARPAWLSRLPALLVALTGADLLGAHYLSADSAFDIGRGERRRPPVLRSAVELGPDNFARGYAARANQHLYSHKPVYCSYAAMLNRQHLFSAKSEDLMKFATGHERIWFSPAVVEAPVSDDAFEVFAQVIATRQAPVLLWHPRATMLREEGGAGGHPPTGAPVGSASTLDAEAIRQAPTATRVPFEVQTYRANDLCLKVQCPTDGWLLVTDRWSRSWHATVNGVETPVDGGNFFFRLVPVRAGENVVTMNFEPFLLWPLLAASWGTLLAVALAAIVRNVRRSRPRSPVPFPTVSTTPVPCVASS